MQDFTARAMGHRDSPEMEAADANSPDVHPSHNQTLPQETHPVHTNLYQHDWDRVGASLQAGLKAHLSGDRAQMDKVLDEIVGGRDFRQTDTEGDTSKPPKP